MAVLRESNTPYGRLIVGERDDLFVRVAVLAESARTRVRGRAFAWALSGGSTPKDFYRWAVSTRALAPDLAKNTHFTVSDERVVPLDSDQSNFGVADRMLLAPLNVPETHRHPWPVDLLPPEAAAAYRETWSAVAGPGRSYDLCLLGMGDDAHTASFFPGTAVFDDDGGLPFAAIDTGVKGWRLTITPTGLRTCGTIVVLALGAAKAPALRRVMKSDEPWKQVPAKILSTVSDRVVWLVDPAAAAQVA